MSEKTNPSINETSAKRINQVLEEKGWSKSQLARELGVTVQAVQHWAKGNSSPRGNNLIKLAEVSGKPEFWFLQENENVEKAYANQYSDKGEFSQLNEEQIRLLQVFQAFPPVERRNMLAAFEMRLQELNDYYDRYIKNGLNK